MQEFLTGDFALFVLIGFFAQLVDGALGQAFGLLCTSALMATGVPAAAASATTHVAEIFTTAASGVSHAWQRNVNWRLVARLAVPGMIGGAVGAYALSRIDAAAIAPFVSAYLLAMGLLIGWRAFHEAKPRDVDDAAVPVVGLVGGTMDAMGGGGWGPVVTSTLIGRGHDPRKVIGSTNLTEFLVTLVISATFVLSLGFGAIQGAAGLIVGGVIAAPVGALLVHRLPRKPLMVMVAVLITGTAALRLLGVV